MQNNVLLLIQGNDIAASRYRILQYVPYLEDRGMVCSIREFPRSLREYASLLADLPRYACVFVQRKRFHFPILPLFQRRARRIVYDLDDAVMYKNSLARSHYSRTRQRRFMRMVKASDVIIAGNSFLKEKALEYHSCVEVIPSSIPIGKYGLKDYSVQKEKVTIGWIGDHGSIHYLERLRHVWDELARRHPGRVELKIICDTFFDCRDMPVRKVYWSNETEVAELQGFDIGVMPLKDDPWSWGKCGLKILQYFGVGVPAVCTPVGVNRDVVVHGSSGYWARTDHEWVEMISLLVEDASLRMRFGLAGREILEKGYTKEANEPRMFDIIAG